MAFPTFFVILGARLLRAPSLSGPLTHLCDLEAGYEGDGLQSWITQGGDRTPALRVKNGCDSDELSPQGLFSHLYRFFRVGVLYLQQGGPLLPHARGGRVHPHAEHVAAVVKVAVRFVAIGIL